MEKTFNLSEIMTRKKAELDSSKIEPNTQIRMSIEEQVKSVIGDYEEAKALVLKDKMDAIIGKLENGIINIRGNEYHNEKNANIILENLISIEHPPKEKVLEPQMIDEEADADEEWIKEVKEGIALYADDMIYESCILWCEALRWDRRMVAPILKGSNEFFRQMEALGYPHLCLLIQATR